MVSETLEEQVDQAVTKEQETEVVPDEEPLEVPPEDDAAPADDGAAAVEEPEPTFTAEQVRQFMEQQAETARRQRQAEAARKAEQERREREEREEVMDTFGAELTRLGVEVDDPQKLTRPFDRYVNKRRAQIETQTIDATDRAFAYLAAPVFGTEAPVLTPTEEKLATKLQPHFQRLIDSLAPIYERQIHSGFVPRSEIPKLLKAEMEAENARRRQAKTDLQHPEGTAGPTGVPTPAEYNAMTREQRAALPTEVKDQIASRASGR